MLLEVEVVDDVNVRQILPKFNFSRGSAPDFTGGPYSAPPGPLAGGEDAGSPRTLPLPRPSGLAPSRFSVSMRWQP